jgi:[ribosomal protein S5]-alanine N-acetyltransferase
MRLETHRLLLSRPRLSDAPELLQFLGDLNAMRHTFGVKDLKECRRYIAGHDCQRRKVGYGPWTVRTKADERIMGFGGLYDDPFDPGWGIEVSYRFAPFAWGKGYATELTAFCVTFARVQLGKSVIRAFAHPDNGASRRVLSKTGFKQRQFVSDMNRYLYEYRFENPDAS